MAILIRIVVSYLVLASRRFGRALATDRGVADALASCLGSSPRGGLSLAGLDPEARLDVVAEAYAKALWHHVTGRSTLAAELQAALAVQEAARLRDLAKEVSRVVPEDASLPEIRMLAKRHADSAKLKLLVLGAQKPH